MLNEKCEIVKTVQHFAPPGFKFCIGAFLIS